MLFKSNEKKVKVRICILATMMTLTFGGLMVRLAYIQLTEGPALGVSANKQYYYEEYTDNINFKLLDRNSENLFNHTVKYYVVIDPMTFFTLNEESAFLTMKNISYILRDYDKDYDVSLLQYEMEGGNHSYEVDKESYEKLVEIKDVRGMYVYEYMDYEKNNNWNIKNLLSSSVKSSDNNQLKDEGTLEREIHEYVKDNKEEVVRFEKDVSGNIIGETIASNENNRNVVTTLDDKVQDKVEEVLRDEKYEEYKQIGAVIMESKTGDILAMAQKNDSLSNVNIGVPSGSGFLLGSTFKTIVYEAALEKGLVTQDEKFHLKGIFPSSIEKLGSYNIHQAYVASSNDTFAQIGWKVGMDNIYEIANKQGLFDSTLGLQDEKKGEIEGYKKEKNLDIITNSSIGQTVRSTPVAALAIPNTVVNNGIYVKPRIIKEIVTDKSEIVKKYDTESARVFSEYTASVIKDGMIGVVNDDLGTGSNARVEKVEVGGKTGTTEYLDGEKKCSDGWFTGFFQHNNKYYSMVIYLPQIEDKSGDSKTACLVFQDLVENLVKENYLN